MPRQPYYEDVLCSGPSETLRCRHAGCNEPSARVIPTTQRFYVLDFPFCLEHSRMLSRKTFNKLHAVAGASVFDIESVAEAAALVAAARLELRQKGKKR